MDEKVGEYQRFLEFDKEIEASMKLTSKAERRKILNNLRAKVYKRKTKSTCDNKYIRLKPHKKI